ncbi:HlyD family secretion protein [Novosphingobium album (ex Hu et al. 2023)]|uniref:HlyD family secretion protein n=1 Tax=Novosphingobium album (ex Hu et al. 2023) TaxID=2930093 RepID=A0ABT0AW66_9SPHN|nr:HlyD family secretion protein [Novosphingobium album (ex Hu et al. 2023)]MCJ2176964.1 HlyD family secretion protein [Novosphingobium album (ex Hu et al. 2023)]
MSLQMSSRRQKTVSIAVTGMMVLASVLGGKSLYSHYQDDPWTRDGRIRADVIRIAPDVAGLVTAVHFDHDQTVHRGDVLFEIDPSRYRLALDDARTGVQQATADLDRARAAVARAQASMAEARREATRDRSLGELLASETAQQSETRAQETAAGLAEARAEVEQAQGRLAAAHNVEDLAKLNLARTKVVAPVDGFMSDMSVRRGNYVSAGSPVLALVDTSTLRVEGYFEETKLPNVRIGQKAVIRVMGEDKTLHGHVFSIARAIEDHDRNGAADLLPAINPSFSWVRLPQRVPVRITLDNPTAGIALISGRTVSVSLERETRK